MRLLLAEEKIYPDLHKDAARYFEQQPQKFPARWADWTCEAIYHRFQLEGPKAASFWRELVKSKRATTDMKVRLQLAAEITRRDYVDVRCAPLKWRESSAETIIKFEDLCEAYHEAAIASIGLTAGQERNTKGYAKQWSDARQHLLKLRATMEEVGEFVFRPQIDVEAFIRLASELSKLQPDPDVVLSRWAPEANSCPPSPDGSLNRNSKVMSSLPRK